MRDRKENGRFMPALIVGGLVNVVVLPAAVWMILGPVTVKFVIVLLEPVNATGPVPPAETVMDGYTLVAAPVANDFNAEDASVMK